MPADRPTRASRRRGAEVVKMTHDASSAHSPQRVAEPLEIAGRETQVIQQIIDCLEQLTHSVAAKRELCALSAAEVQDAVEYRQAISVVTEASA